jgi:Flp pilus assembly protein TadB
MGLAPGGRVQPSIAESNATAARGARQPSTPGPLPDLLKKTARRRPLWQRVLLVAGAVLAFLAGIVGWLIPAVTGLPFYVVGFVLLAMASTRVRLWINRVERRLPHRWRQRLRNGVRKIPSKKLQAMFRL